MKESEWTLSETINKNRFPELTQASVTILALAGDKGFSVTEERCLASESGLSTAF